MRPARVQTCGEPPLTALPFPTVIDPSVIPKTHAPCRCRAPTPTGRCRTPRAYRRRRGESAEPEEACDGRPDRETEEADWVADAENGVVVVGVGDGKECDEEGDSADQRDNAGLACEHLRPERQMPAAPSITAKPMEARRKRTAASAARSTLRMIAAKNRNATPASRLKTTAS